MPWTDALNAFAQFQHICLTCRIKAINPAGSPPNDKRLTHGQISYRHLEFVEKDRSFLDRLLVESVFIGIAPIIPR
jgi:hypothetical protein